MKRLLGKFRWSQLFLVTSVLLVVGLVAATFMVAINDRHQLIRTNEALIEQLRDAGETPVVSSPSEVVQGTAGEPGRPPTESEVRAAVVAYCSTGDRCMGARGQLGATGPAGPAGEPGAASTVPGPVGAAGAAGRAGVDGADGTNGLNGAAGADSTVPGPVGPAGPAGAAGADGAPGAPGAPGTDGRSVSSVSCVLDGLTAFLVFADQSGVEIGRVQSMCTPS